MQRSSNKYIKIRCRLTNRYNVGNQCAYTDMKPNTIVMDTDIAVSCNVESNTMFASELPDFSIMNGR